MTLLNLTVNDLTRFTPQQALDFFRSLLWAESVRVSVSRNLLNVPDRINVGDGGLDATIEDAFPDADDVIPRGYSGFQIKKGDLGPSRCKQELHKAGDPNELKDGVKKVMDNGGTYVLVLFAEAEDAKYTSRRSAIIEELERCGYSKPRVRLYTANQILSFAERFPRFNRFPECVDYEHWTNFGDVRLPINFVADDSRTQAISAIRDKLRESRLDACVMRIEALSGLGKTRLAYEALKDYDLRNITIYVKAEEFLRSSLYPFLRTDRNSEAIVVIDECSLEAHKKFSNELRQANPGLAFITISNELSGYALEPVFKLEPLSRDQIARILEQEIPSLPFIDLDKFARFADGYPGFAALFAEYYRNNKEPPQDTTDVNDVNLLNKIIAGGNADPAQYSFRTTKQVLMGLALFTKVGYRSRVESEAKFVSKLIDVNWSRFREVVKQQTERGIIKGDYYLRVTPFPLAVYLVKEWWQTYGHEATLDEVLRDMPEDLLPSMFDRFTENFRFVGSVKAGKDLVHRLLSSDGPFKNGSLLKTARGARFFLRLSEADIGSAVDCLERTLGAWNKRELLEFRTGRREVLYSLQMIARWRDYFARAARLLLRLAVAENESYANNATGIFVGLFSSATGPAAPTEASPNERLPVLNEALDSSSADCRRLGLKAIEQALQWQGSALVILDTPFAGPTPQLWSPETNREIFEYYRVLWKRLEADIREEGETRHDSATVILNSAQSLSSLTESLGEMVLKTLSNLASHPWMDKTKILKTVTSILRYVGPRMSQTMRDEWTDFQALLTGSSFSDLLKRFVGLDLLEDTFQNGEHYNTTWVDSNISELARKALENPNLLSLEFKWLATDKAKRGFQFGHELGKQDMSTALLPQLLDVYAKAIEQQEEFSAYFLGGYFLALFETKRSIWELTMEKLCDDEILRRLVPELCWRSGINDTIARRLALMAERQQIDILSLGMFRYGTIVSELTEQVFTRLVQSILQAPSGNGAPVALVLIESRYARAHGRAKMPNALVENVLMHPAFWGGSENILQFQGIDDDWANVADAFLSQYPEEEVQVADRILNCFGDKTTVVGRFQSPLYGILLNTIKRNPRVLWKRIVNYLGPPVDERAFDLARWLKGEKGLLAGGPSALEYVNREDIWQWIDENVEKRAWHFATFVAPDLEDKNHERSLAWTFLQKYGDSEQVRRSFSTNYSTEFGWGSMAQRLIEKRQKLLKLKENANRERDANVLNWIDEYAEQLLKEIEMYKLWEEEEQF
jgi:hypothetical protein